MPAELPPYNSPEDTAAGASGEQPPHTATGGATGSVAESAAAESAAAESAAAESAAGPASDSGPSSPRGTLQGRWRVLSRLPIIMMLASLLLGLGIVQLTFQIGNSIYRSATWQNETRETKARVVGLQKDVKILQDAENSASDPAYLEQLARCQGFVGQGEAVVVSPHAPTNPGESCTPVRLP